MASLQSLAKENLSYERGITGTNLLEKSKSDSRINNKVSLEAGNKANSPLVPIGDEEILTEAIKRSISNQNIILPGKKSPKKQTKKSKSYSKLTEGEPLNCSPTGQLLVNVGSKGSTTDMKLLKRLKKSPMSRLKHSRKPKEEILVVEVQEGVGSTGRCSAEIQEFSISTTGENEGDENGDDEDEEDTSLESDLLAVTSLQEYSILEQCIKQYEMFFQVFFSRQIFTLLEVKQALSEHAYSDETESIMDEYSAASLYHVKDYVVVGNQKENQLRMIQIDEIFETLLVVQPRPQIELDRLLEETILTDSGEKIKIVSNTNQHGAEGAQNPGPKLVNKLTNLKLYESLRTALKLAASLLVDLSTFPNYNQHPFLEPLMPESKRLAEKIDCLGIIPYWLKMLIIGSCYLRNDKEVRINCISMLFELVSLLQAQYEPHALANPGVTYVVMLPLMRIDHIRALEKGTRVFQLLTSILWDYLADDSMDRFLVTSLLYQLHASLEHLGLVESVISHRLSNSHLKWKFDCESSNREDDESDGDGGIDPFAEDERMRGRLYRYSSDQMDSVKILCPVPLPNMFTCIDYLDESQKVAFRKFELLWHLGRDRMTVGFDRITFQVSTFEFNWEISGCDSVLY